MTDINTGVQPQGGAPAVQPNPTPAPVAQAPVAQPENVSDRTAEQFQKLLDSNRQLYEQNEAMRKEMKERFTPAPAPAPAPTQQAQVDDFIEVDPATGQPYINEQRLRSKVKELEEAARRAEQKADNFVKSTQEREIERQNREAFAAFPELNPQAQNFDRDFNMQTRALIMDSWVNPQDYGGRPLEFAEAAGKVRGWKAAPTVQQPTPTPIPIDDTSKAQATADLPNTPQRTYAPDSGDELVQLQQLTRRGGPAGDKALAQRLMHTEHIVGPNTVVQGGE